MTIPAISVIVPTYERRDLTLRAARSVLGQTRQDFELIVVDGDSRDGTADALRGLDPRLVLLTHPNEGASKARNVALAHATAPVVAFLDSDNTWLPDHAETVLAMLERHPEAVVASTAPSFVVAGRQPVARTQVRDVLEESLIGGTIGYTSAIAARRWAVERVGGFDEGLAVIEDTDLWVRLATLGPFAFLQRATMHRQETAGSLAERGRRDGVYFAALERHGERTAELLERTPGHEALAPHARANAAVARALAALEAHDHARAAAMLAEACALQPALHRWPGITAHRLTAHLPSSTTRQGRTDAFRRCADAWPQPDALTPRWLRLNAVAFALAAGDRGAAREALRGWPARGTARFGRDLAPIAFKHVARRLRDRATRGAEPVLS